MTNRYLQTLRRQSQSVMAQVPAARFCQLAIGGGTPSYLNLDELQVLFDILSDDLDVLGKPTPIAMEVSPATVDRSKLHLMKDFGVDRVSMGVQSFNGRDVGALGRPQKQQQVLQAIDMIQEHGFETVNLDLIYGGAGQTLKSWLDSVDQAANFSPEEIYLYPLYVRELTGLSKRIECVTDEVRLDFYRHGRDRLLEAGYQQVSMRMFRRRSIQQDPLTIATDYRCQQHGMIGLGCGARSYTSDLHYGSQYAVRQPAIAAIIDGYVQQSGQDFSEVCFGFELDEAERRRRHVILSIFLAEGLNVREYCHRFSTQLIDDFPQLLELAEENLATIDDDRIRLTAEGLACSDSIGPWLYSENVRQRMEVFSWTNA